MSDILRKIPIPMAGLMLALASTGNLLLSYGSMVRNLFGIISAILFLLLAIKLIYIPKSLKEAFDNPVTASVTPTFSMGLMILTTYVKPYFPAAAYALWWVGFCIHALLMLCFTKKYIFSFNIKKVFASYFVVYVGIVCASITAPAFGLNSLGQFVFWFGFIAYLILLPLVLYRIIVIKEIPEPAIPTITILTAPSSLCLAGYLNSFSEKNMSIVALLSVISVIMLLSVIIYIPKMLKLKFYPSYSAFTFPFVITAIAMKGTNALIIKTIGEISYLWYFIKLLEAWSVIIGLYVLLRYIMFIFTNTDSSLNAVNKKAAIN